MPKGTISKKSRRVDDDDIEEGSSSQQQASGSNARRGGANASGVARKRERERERAREEEDEDVDQDDDDDDEDAAQNEADARTAQEIRDLVEPKEFPNQPLPNNVSTRIRGLTSNWEVAASNFKDLYSRYKNTASLLQASSGPGDESKEVAKLDVSLRELIDMEVKMKAYHETLLSIEQAAQKGQLEDTPSSIYKAEITAKLTAYKKKTTRQKYGSNSIYRDFREGVFEEMMPDVPMPPLKSSMPKEEGDEEESDDDIEIGGSTRDYKDPITLRLLQDPVTTRNCHHSFSRDTIMSMFNKPTIACPAQMCKQMITREDLIRDKDLEKRVKAFARREEEEKRRREADVEEIDDSEEEDEE